MKGEVFQRGERWFWRLKEGRRVLRECPGPGYSSFARAASRLAYAHDAEESRNSSHAKEEA
jgi:hypothetical protein